MSVCKGQTTIKFVKQGDTLNCNLRSTFPLKQFISNGNGVVSPSFASNKPCIYPVVRSSLQAARVAVKTTGYQWYYNGVEIAFKNGLSTAIGGLAAGTFKTEYKTIDGFSVPTLTILKDIASSGNIDSDTIEFKGIVNTGFETTVSASIDIEIEQTDGEAYLAYIAVNNGGVIDDVVQTLTATAHLLVGGAEKTSSVTYKWYKMNVTNGVDGWQKLSNTSKSITISKADVNSSELYKCELSYGGKLTSAVLEVVDETDVLIIFPNPTDSDGKSVPEEVSSVQTSIYYRPKVLKRSTSEEVSGYTLNYLLTKSDGTEIASQDGGSSFMVTYAQGLKAGGDLTLIISAE
jgi:hypothetical protein